VLSIVQQTNANADDEASTRVGVPDYRVDVSDELQGYVELKAVIGKDITRLKDKHDITQHERFCDGLPNWLYANGWQWCLYQDGQLVQVVVTIGDDGTFDPNSKDKPSVPTGAELDALDQLFGSFLSAKQVSYTDARVAVRALAFRARAIESVLIEEGEAHANPALIALRDDFRSLLFRHGQELTWEKFVDSYVQIAVFGVLLWRLETGTQLSRELQAGVTGQVHPLLHQCLAILWNQDAASDALGFMLDQLCRTINLIPTGLFTIPQGRDDDASYAPDPIINAYEPFFDAYDHAAREANGVYYTPIQIVQQIVGGVDYLLRNSCGRTEGLLDEDVQILDPATGTGTFLLGLANAVYDDAVRGGESAAEHVEDALMRRTAALELFPGPYAIAHQRIEAALQARGVHLKEPLPIYLTDTLAAPDIVTLPMSNFGDFGQAFVREAELVDHIKTSRNLLVILGNPPWERMSAGTHLPDFANDLLKILKDNTPIEARQDLKSTRDLFVAFWLWALWALQSPQQRSGSAQAPHLDTLRCNGIVAFITNRTWIGGKSLTGLRHLVRQGATEIWVLDLGGDARGAHGATAFAGGDANVFGIQTGAAIVWAVFNRDKHPSPTVRYRRVFGTRGDKLKTLTADFDPKSFKRVSKDRDTFIPAQWSSITLSGAPTLSELFASEPLTGILTSRDKAAADRGKPAQQRKGFSPLGVDCDEVLAEGKPDAMGNRRLVGDLADWATLLPMQRVETWQKAEEKRHGRTAPSTNLDTNKMRRILYRPFDWRWVYDDPAWITWYRPDLQRVFSNGPVPTLVTIEDNHGRGPAVLHSSMIMDQHSFRGSDGGKSLYPAKQADGPWNFTPLVSQWLISLGRKDQFDTAYYYILAILSAPSYTEENWKALTSDTLRVPLTADVSLFDEAMTLGQHIATLWERSLDGTQEGDRRISWEQRNGSAAYGKATHDGDRITFDNGRELSGVGDDVWGFQVSGYQVLPRYFAGRAGWTPNLERTKEMLDTVRCVAHLVDALREANTIYHQVLEQPTFSGGK